MTVQSKDHKHKESITCRDKQKKEQQIKLENQANDRRKNKKLKCYIAKAILKGKGVRESKH